MNLLASAKRMAEAQERLIKSAAVLAEKIGLTDYSLEISERDVTVRRIMELESISELLENAAKVLSKTKNK
jgi:hypothetical protein